MASRKAARDEPLLWERQIGESEQAWEAFLTFRDMGSKRSVHGVCEALSKSRPLISRWKARWYWEDRCRAYDNELQRQAFRDAVKERKKMNERHINLSLRLQKAAFDALEKKDFSDMSDRDISSFVRIAAELERIARADDLSLKERPPEEEGVGGDVVIYVPDNGMGTLDDE